MEKKKQTGLSVVLQILAARPISDGSVCRGAQRLSPAERPTQRCWAPAVAGWQSATLGLNGGWFKVQQLRHLVSLRPCLTLPPACN